MELLTLSEVLLFKILLFLLFSEGVGEEMGGGGTSTCQG